MIRSSRRRNYLYKPEVFYTSKYDKPILFESEKKSKSDYDFYGQKVKKPTSQDIDLEGLKKIRTEEKKTVDELIY